MLREIKSDIIEPYVLSNNGVLLKRIQSRVIIVVPEVVKQQLVIEMMKKWVTCKESQQQVKYKLSTHSKEFTNWLMTS